MTAPRSIRFEDETLERLAAYAARHPGVSSSSAAARLVEEGLRMDAHPGVVFRDGPRGRRAVLVGGPDVWEVIKAVRDVADARPRLAREGLVAAVAEVTAVPAAQVRNAIAYYGDFPEEIVAAIDTAERAERDLAESLARTTELLRG